MTKLILSTTAAILALTGSAFAMSGAAAEIDADGDGILSVVEVQAIYPDVTAEQFSEMDLNADGALDDNEVQAAQAAGLMPIAPSEG
jgi:hypothetical protein